MDPNNGLAKRRKIRKGTHSCWECKRRKVRCLFANPGDSRCITCHRRGKECVGQDVYDEIEVAMTSSQRTPLTSNGTSPQYALSACGLPTGTESCTHEATSEMSETRGVADTSNSHGAPRTTLLTPGATPPTVATFNPSHVNAKATRALIKALPSRSDLSILLQMVSSTHLPFYQHNHKYGKFAQRDELSQEVTAAGLYAPHKHPVLLARQMLFLVVALQHCQGEDMAGLSETSETIARRVADAVIESVTSNDRLVDTSEGIDNLALEACYHTNNGDVRRAWMVMRRAVMVAQMMGVDRHGAARSVSLSDTSSVNIEMIWPCTVTMERIISLSVGLPTSTSGIVIACNTSPEQGGNLYTLAQEAVRIIQRNELTNLQQAVARTEEIDRDLIKISQQLPADFWRPCDFSSIRVDSEQAPIEIQRAWDHLCYQSMVNHLHLPDMLHAANWSKNLYARNACVHASQEILHRHVALRTFNPVHPVCHMGDFIALTAGLTLMLAHIVSHSIHESASSLIHQRSGDRAIVERMLQCNDSLAKMQPHVVVAKGALALRQLLEIEVVAMQQKCSTRHLPFDGNMQNDCNLLLIRVPNSAFITIARDEMVVKSYQLTCLDSVNGFSVGGIGYIHINAAVEQMPDLPELRSASMMAETAGAAADAQDRPLPNFATNVNDWVFQGFDTAYLENMMPRQSDMDLLNMMNQEWPIT